MAEADRIDQPSPRARHLGGWLMWFAVLGGALAWTLHLFVSWGTEELACSAGSTTVDGVPLEAIIGAGVVLPALATVAALALSLRAWRRLSGRRNDRRMERAAMLALIGVGANTLFLAIIVVGGAALLVFPPCQQ